MRMKHKITTSLWFDNTAEEAANFYVSVFPDSRIVVIARSGEAGPGPVGSVLAVRFELMGVELLAINGGPHFKLSEAASLLIDCETQEEIDRLWDVLVQGGGSHSQCGWLKDRFGLSWQVSSSRLPGLIADPDPARAARAMRAMLAMTKIDLAALDRAHAG
ncbi:VOC family protein [Zavarzinia sp. CC-PAN008]|uniref:VOC family protein n=1 Tax=Zavarzinia sp. CC-PAN008 TaxID=3243332 RepID=UPI003F7438A5